MTGDVYVHVGGAIFATSSNVIITKSNFVGNSAEIGGAIYVRDFSKVMIIDSIFVKNQAANADLNVQCFDIVLYRKPWTKNDTAEFRYCCGGVIAIIISK